MFDRILVPLDGSPVAEYVIPYAVLLAKRLAQPVILVTVVDTRDLPLDRDGKVRGLIEMQRSFGYDYLDKTRQRFEAEGISTSIEAAIGPAATAILDAAKSHDVGLIAMGTHGRAGVERWRLGSVSDRVLRTASAPILLVRPPHDGEVRAAPAVPAIQHIVLPLDGSPLAEAALPVARALAGAFSAPVTVARTVSFAWYAAGGASPYDGLDAATSAELLAAMEDDARAYVEGIVEQLRQANLAASVHVSHGVPGDPITELAAATPGSLVVMSTHGRSGLGRTLLGSVTDHVVRSSAAPVLIVRGQS